MKRFNWEQDQIAHMKVKLLFFTFMFANLHLDKLNKTFPLFPELHSTVWTRLCKVGPAGTKQRENAAENGRLRVD